MSWSSPSIPAYKRYEDPPATPPGGLGEVERALLTWPLAGTGPPWGPFPPLVLSNRGEPQEEDSPVSALLSLFSLSPYLAVSYPHETELSPKLGSTLLR